MSLFDDFGNKIPASEFFTAEDQARMSELRLAVVANQAARAHSRNAITQRQCTQRIEAAREELEALETLKAMAEEAS